MTNLLETVDEWTRITNNKRNIDCIHLDFMKAFDTVPHQRVISKVKGYGIGGKIQGWFKSFLTGMKQRVALNSEQSSWEDVIS